MQLSDADQLADGIVRQVRDYVARAMAPLMARIAALEAREPRDGRDGRDATGIDGINGKDGRDGLGFDDLDVVYDGERTLTVRFMQGERMREFPCLLPIVLDRGVYKDGRDYERGDAVTWAGSLWIAQEPTGEKPDGGGGWRLAVKRGRDGKDAPK
jgi:hypothetical protein